MKKTYVNENVSPRNKMKLTQFSIFILMLIFQPPNILRYYMTLSMVFFKEVFRQNSKQCVVVHESALANIRRKEKLTVGDTSKSVAIFENEGWMSLKKIETMLMFLRQKRLVITSRFSSTKDSDFLTFVCAKYVIPFRNYCYCVHWAKNVWL